MSQDPRRRPMSIGHSPTKLHIQRSLALVSLVVCMSFMLSGRALAAVNRIIVYRPYAGACHQVYLPSTHAKMVLLGTEKMNNAVIGDVDGKGREDDIVYSDAVRGGLGYYQIPADGKWHPERDHVIPNVATDAVPMTVLRTRSSKTVGLIVYRSAGTGNAYGINPSGSGLTSLGRVDNAFAVDARNAGYKGDLLWWVSGGYMKWRTGLTGTDHKAPYSDWRPLGGGKVLSSYPTQTIAFFASQDNDPTIYMCDQNFKFTKVAGTEWPWTMTAGTNTFSDVDGDGYSEVIYVKSATDPLQWYNVPATGSTWNASGVVTESSITCGWNLDGAGMADITVPAATSVSLISSLRAMADGTLVQISSKPRTKLVREIISGQTRATGFYVEESDRSSGIRVIGTTTAAEGQFLTVKGSLSTLNGEKVIIPTDLTAATTTAVISPVASTVSGVMGTSALAGVLTQATGTVASKGTGWFTMTDGTKTVKVYCADAIPTSTQVTTNGCVGAEVSGTSVVPVIRVGAGSDVVAYSAPPPPPPPDPDPTPDPTPTPTPVGYSLWIRPTLTKVLKTDTAQAFATPTIRAAKNEHEGFQIVLRGGSAQISSVAIAAKDLTSAGGTITASNVSVLIATYINLPALGKDYPDPLPPYQSPFNLAAGQTQPIWVDVFVPKTAAAGDYNGTVTITDGSGQVVNVPFVLHVYNFTLPDAHKCSTAFGLEPDQIAAKHGVAVGSTQHQQLHKKYYEMLLAHGISSFYEAPLYPWPDALFTDEGAKYLTDPRLTTFWIYPYINNPTIVKQILDRMRQLGVFDKHYFYQVDEPVTSSSYQTFFQQANAMHAVDPAAQMMTPYWRNPDWTTQSAGQVLTGYCDIWCPMTDLWDRDTTLASFLNTRRGTDEKFWNYVATGPGYPYCNFTINYACLELRMWLWQTYRYDTNGILYWAANYWGDVSDPWTNPNTVSSTSAYGGGTIMYPGNKVGIDGPVGSIRMEMIRDGLEDFDYLWLLEQKIGRSAVLPYVQKLTTSWTSYTRDQTLFDSVRDQIGRAIEN